MNITYRPIQPNDYAEGSAPMNVQVVSAKLSDLERIQELNLALFNEEIANYDDTLNADWVFGEGGTNYFKGCIEKDSNCAFVARMDHKIVGYLAGVVYERQNPCRTPMVLAELENMYVEPEYRSQSIGAKLVEEFKTWAKHKGATRIRVETNTSNTRAIDFYKRTGFESYNLILEQSL